MNRRGHTRGNERSDHLELKPRGRAMLLASGCEMASCEYHNADVIGFRRQDGGIHVTAIEYERTARNVIRNIQRDLAHRVDVVVVACMTKAVQRTTDRLVSRRLEPSACKKVRVVCADELSEAYFRSLARAARVDSGMIRVDSEVESAGSQVCSG